MIKQGWIPPLSPYGLIQETLFPNEWMILVACIMLNCTTRKQVEKIIPEFIKRWNSPLEFLLAKNEDIIEIIKPLGFSNKRSISLTKMTDAYVNTKWKHASELPGIGAYGARSWEIFCQGVIGDNVPSDHALVLYFRWAKRLE